MEQNEEVLIRVYQEKERNYKIQLEDLKQKLDTAQQGESALRKQLSQSDGIRQQLQKSVQILNEEKTALQRRCGQIEHELQQLRARLDERCISCRHHQQTQSIYENNGSADGGKPMPKPRLMSNKEPSNDRELRSEVEDLRGEISSLREQLNQQINIFADERRRWQNEKNVC
jgi:predicted nuclease with TOPRIM domain